MEYVGTYCESIGEIQEEGEQKDSVWNVMLLGHNFFLPLSTDLIHRHRNWYKSEKGERKKYEKRVGNSKGVLNTLKDHQSLMVMICEGKKILWGIETTDSISNSHNSLN